ncbi:MAG: coenzyme F420-0:L-glutamate ligase [Novosphingobium sp.]|nr:coenzyme F420-0:L-glutamate ligase [Novosphingobium sp.]
MTIEAGLSFLPLTGMPLFQPGMSVAGEVLAALDRAGEVLCKGDICVVAQKIVSKAEGRVVRLADVEPTSRAREIAEETGRDPHVLQLILDESRELLRTTEAAVIARHTTGHVLANAGIDASNIEGSEDENVLLWPVDPDASARAIRAELADRTGISPAVLIADSMGRAWRNGTVGTAIGCAGMTVLDDQRGTEQDLFGRTLQATVIAIADSIGATASLAMGEGAQGTPALLVRGGGQWVTPEDGPGAVSGLRAIVEDMFR